MKKAIWIAVPLMALMALMLVTPAFTEPVAETWVMMHGMINLYGIESAFGWCGAYAKIGEWARANAFWMPRIGIPPMSEENFTMSFYAARLVNTTMVELNYTGKDFYISGLWDVYNITLTAIPYNVTYTHHNYTVTYTRWNVTWTPEVLVDDGPGELSVTGDWTSFTIDIADPDIKLISGMVIFHRVKPENPIPVGDVYGPMGMPDNTVDIWDLQHVAHNYGSTPVLNFDFSMDFDFDFEIGLCDLTTIAANLGEGY